MDWAARLPHRGISPERCWRTLVCSTKDVPRAITRHAGHRPVEHGRGPLSNGEPRYGARIVRGKPFPLRGAEGFTERRPGWHPLALTDLVASRFAAAEQEYSRSQAACNAARDSDCVARAIVGLAFAQAAQEHFDLAIASYRLGIGAFTALKRREDAARAEVGLSRALLVTGDYPAALSAAVHAHDEGVALGRDDVVWRALVAQARALRRMSDGPRALAKATLAAAVVDRMALASLDRPNEALPSDTAGVYAVLAVLQAEAEMRAAHS